MALRLLVLLSFALVKIGAARLFGVTDGFMIGVAILDLVILAVAPSWVAMAGADRATGPLRTFASVPLVLLTLILMNLTLQLPRLNLERAVLGGVVGAVAVWLLATLVAFAFVSAKMRFVPTSTDRRRAEYFVLTHQRGRGARRAAG
jgi:hypothetical protein